MKSEGDKKPQAVSSAKAPAPASASASSPASAHTNTPAAPAANTKPANVSSTASNHAASDVAFKSSDIGVKTAVKEDPFKKHKQKQAAEKKQRRLIYLVVGIVCVLVVITLIIWLTIALTRPNSDSSTPSDDTTASEEEDDTDSIFRTLPENVDQLYRDAINAAGEDNQNLTTSNQILTNAVNDAKQAVAANPGDSTKQSELNQLQFAELIYYYETEQDSEVVRVNDEIDHAALSLDQLSYLYQLVYLAYYNLGDEAKAEHYLELNGEYTNKVLEGEGKTEIDYEALTK